MLIGSAITNKNKRKVNFHCVNMAAKYGITDFAYVISSMMGGGKGGIDSKDWLIFNWIKCK